MTTASTPGPGGSPGMRAALSTLLAAAAVVVTMAAGAALDRIGRPFPGFFLWENGFVPAVGLPSWSGAVAGLPYHSWIEAVDGATATTAAATVASVERAVATKPVGAAVEYRYVHGDRHAVAAVPTEAFSVGHFVSSTGVYLFDAVVLLLLAGTMFYVGAGDAGPRAVGLFALAQSMYLATAIDLFGPYRFREAYFFFAGLTPTATLFMISRFPVARLRRRAEDVALGACVLASVAFGALSNARFENPADRDGLLQLDFLVHLAMAASALAAFAFFGWNFLRGRDETVRRRCQVVLLASLGGFLPTMVFLLLFYVGGVSLPFNFLAVPFVLFPLGIGYAVSRLDLFDVDTVVKRTIVWATLSAAVFAVYSLAIGAFDAIFEGATPVASRLAEGAVIVTLIGLFEPSRRRLQETVNRLYDRRRWEYRDVVRSAVRAFSTILETERLLPTVLALVDETAQPTFARVYTMQGDDAPRLRGRLVHEPGTQPSIDVVDGAGEEPALARVARAAAAAEVLSAAERDAGMLDGTGAAVALGLALEGRATGLVLVGPRRSGSVYTREDLDLLRTIAGQLAVALQNAESFRTIDTLNRDLADRNVELRDALDDLRAAQDELVVKERLAAVGEIAGAVAHTIRNPLAGMRASAQQASIELADHPVTELVDAFVRETDRLASRIDDLLDFARPFHVAAKPCRLGELAARAAEQVAGRAAQRSIAVQVDDAAGDATAMVDPALFEQLVIELVANAVDATPDGTRVEVKTGRDAKRGWIEVLDQGPGIPVEQRERMFRMFYTTKKKGTGIGLATVKRIADSHRATVEVGDAPGGGARMRVVLALVDAAA